MPQLYDSFSRLLWPLRVFYVSTFFYFVKNAIGILIGIALSCYGLNAHFNNIGSLIYDHGMPFHLFISSVISFITVLQFQGADLPSPWSNLFLGILLFLCYCKLDFLKFPFLILRVKEQRISAEISLYPATLLILFISWNQFLIESLPSFSVYEYVVCKQRQFKFLIADTCCVSSLVFVCWSPNL